MRLTAKLATVIVLGFIILIAIYTSFSVRRDVSRFQNDMKRDAAVIVRVMRRVLEYEWATNGVEKARQTIRDLNFEDQSLRFRWIWLDAVDDDLLRPQIPPESLDPLERGVDVSVTALWKDGREYLFTYTPLSLEGERPAALVLATSIAPIDAFARSIRRRAVALAATSALLGAVVTFSLGVLMVGRPLHAIIGKLRRVGTGDLHDPLILRGRDELAELAGSVNSMCDDLAEAHERVRRATIERIKAFEQLRHADRLATVGTLASGIAHELGTPLNVVSGRAGLIGRGSLSPEDVIASTEIIRAQTDRMTTIIRQLLDFARRQDAAVAMVNVHDLLQESTKLLKSIARKSSVEIDLPAKSDMPPVSADRGQLEQVFTNLIMNAIQAMPGGGRIEVTLVAIHAKPPEGHDGHEGEYLRIDVQDEGEGIPAENLRHLFDPFFTTKDVGEGTGLGLSIAWGIVNDHGGWIDVSSRPGEGSCLSVFLPLERAHARPNPDC